MGSPIPCASTMAIPGTRAWRTPWSDWAPSCAAAAAVSAPRRLELTGIFSGHLLLAPARVRPYCFPWGGATRPFQGTAMRFVIVFLLLAVITSLFSGLYFVGKDRGTTNRTVISLTIRIALSLVVFFLLIASHFFGSSLR